jgi:hypothetical protein
MTPGILEKKIEDFLKESPSSLRAIGKSMNCHGLQDFGNLADMLCPMIARRNDMMARTHLINRERARCQRFDDAARREEGEYPLWIFD